MFFQILHLYVNIKQCYPFCNIFFNILNKEIVHFAEFLKVLQSVFSICFDYIRIKLYLFISWISKIFLMLIELNFDMIKEFFENLLVIHYKFIDNSSMHILTWKFIWVSINYFCHSSKMSWYCLSISFYYEVVVANYNIYKFVVVN